MTRLVARILLAILMLPAATIVYVIALMAALHTLNPRDTYAAIYLCSTVTWLFVGIYWYALWRDVVVWNGRRLRLSSIAVGCALVVAVLAGLCGDMIERESGIVLGSIIAPLAWLIMVTFIWQETPLERGERLKATSKSAVACPSCGYNLTGLQTTRCPECGRLYTLDELFASQGGRTEAEIEDKI
jgi:hypothetical protein